MWRLLAAQMLQQQTALNKNGTKKEHNNGALDLSHKTKAEPSLLLSLSIEMRNSGTSMDGIDTRNSTTPHEATEHSKKRAPPSESAARLPIQLG